MREVCKLLQIGKLRTSSYYPACNPACERIHRTLYPLMGKVASSRQTDWDEHLPYVAAALSASVTGSGSTGYSTNFLMLGREVNASADIVYGLEHTGLAASYGFTVVSRMVTFPDGFLPERRFPERRFPDGHFPGKTFPGWSFSRMRQFLMINLQAHT